MNTAPQTRQLTHSQARALAPALLLMVVGLFVVAAVGFAGPEVIHNAAHDSRHAFAFPCH
jgi:cobalt transporter subunit CbtB